MNINSTILDKYGREVYALGGETAYKIHEMKGYVISMEWFVGNRSTEPMMVIWPAFAGRRAGAWGICLSSAGKFANPDGTPTTDLLVEAGDVIEAVFGRVATTAEVSTLMDVVMRYVPDLILMPPAPRDVRKEEIGGAVLDVVRKENGKVVQEVSI